MIEHGSPPDEETVRVMAERALAELPPALLSHVEGVSITVEDFADEATLDEMEIESEWELSGLYRGTPLNLRSVTDNARMPDMIFLYRKPILLEWIENGEDLYKLVSNVLVHEIGHHFGLSDEEIEALEASPD